MSHFHVDTPTENTILERRFHSILNELGIEYLTNVKSLPGHPDVVIPDKRVVVELHSCFWHAHDLCPKPIKNACYDWASKFKRTRSNDIYKKNCLMGLGYRVVWIWDCAPIWSVGGARELFFEKFRLFLDCDPRKFVEVDKRFGRDVAEPTS